MGQLIGSRSGKESARAVCCHPACLIYTLRHARLVESQAGIKIGGRNDSHLRHADNTTLMAEIKQINKQKLKSLLIRVKEDSERAGLRVNIKRKKD